MATISYPSAGNLTSLRNKFQSARIFASFHDPDILWSATIHDTVSRGDTSFDFNGGAGANFAAIEADMTVLVGTTPAGSDIGKLRVRSIASGDGGVTGTLVVARHVLSLQNGYFLTFLNTHELWAKYPLIVAVDPENLASSEFFKDGDIAYTSENEDLKPVVIAGPHLAYFIDDIAGYWEITSQLPDSYAMTPGETITAYAASCVPSAGVTININAGTGVGWIRFANPGQYWVKYTITDSNGVSESSYRFYYAHSTDPTDPDYPTTNFDISGITGDWSNGGWTASLNFHDKVSIDMPDETLCIVWAIADYNGNGTITMLPAKSPNLITGYLRQENITNNLETNVERVTHNIETIQAVLNNHYMFSVSLEAKNVSPQYWYEFRNELTNGRAAHHLWRWHSTLMQICDVIGLVDNTDLRAFAEMEDGTLYSMADNMLFENGIRTHVTCDKGGRIWLTPDIQLLDDTERGALNVVFDITAYDESGEVTVLRQTPNRTAFTKVSGFYWDGTFITSATDECPEPPCPDVDPFCSSAPTTIPDDDGPAVTNHDRQTLSSQAYGNSLAGRYLAKENNAYPEFTITTHGNYSGVFDIAYPVFWTTTLSTERFSWIDKNLICRNVTINLNTQTSIITNQVVFEPEADGEDGVAGYCLDDTPTSPGDPDDEPDGSLIVTGSSVYTKSYDGESWTQQTAEDVLDLIKDPFYNSKGGPIIIRGGVGYVKRSTNGGVTWTDITPVVDPPNDASDAPAPTVSTVNYEHLTGNYLNSGEFVALVTWQNGGGEWRSWLLHTDDDWATTTWQSIGAGSAGGYGTPDNYDPLSTIIYSNTYNPRTSCRLTDTTFVYIYISSVFNYPTVVAGEVTGGAVVFDTPQTIVSSATQPMFAINRIDDTHFIAIYKLTSDKNGYAVVGSVSGTTITLGTPVKFYDWVADGGTADNGSYSVTALSSTTVIAALVPQYPTTIFALSVNGYHTRVLTITGTAISFPGSVQLHETSFQTPEVHVTAFSASTAVSMFGIRSGTSTFYVNFYCQVLTVSGGSISVSTKSALPHVGTPDISKGDYGSVEKASATTIVCSHMYNQASTNEDVIVAVVATVSGGSIIFGSYTEIDRIDATTNNYNAVFSTVRTGPGLALVYCDNITDFVAVNCDILGGVVLVANEYPLVTADVTNPCNIAALTETLMVVQYSNVSTLTGEGIPLVFGVATVPTKLLGAVIDRQLGTDLYTTEWRNGYLRLVSYDLLTLSEINTYVFGAATEVQLNAYTYWIYPEADWDNYQHIYVFGRYFDGSTAYLAESVDGGATFIPIITDWRTDYCSAMVVSTTGNLYAIRSSGQLYVNQIAKATLDFLAAVNPHALKVHVTGIYACSKVAGSKMVMRTRPPFTEWADITYDHQNSEAVMAIEIF